MKVKDMIEQLWQLDPESDVGICVVNGDDVRIDSIDQIHPRSWRRCSTRPHACHVVARVAR
jgi:hypothetical protein